jgi:hypothetical protein
MPTSAWPTIMQTLVFGCMGIKQKQDRSFSPQHQKDPLSGETTGIPGSSSAWVMDMYI